MLHSPGGHSRSRRISAILTFTTFSLIFAFRRTQFAKSNKTLRILLTVTAAVLTVRLLRRNMFKLLAGSKYVTDLSRVGQRVGDVPAPKVEEFDIIIIGGGTAGCVLASRLTEDPSLRVLLLESGGSGKSLIFTRLPSAFTLLFHTKHVYELHTEPQAFAREATRYWPRGKMLGGCSSINAQMAQYGAPGDFDEWAKIIGDDSWSWDKFQRYFRKLEKYVPNPEYTGVDANGKGADGPVQIGYFNSFLPQSQDFVASCTKLNIPFNSDFNTTGGTRATTFPRNRQQIMTYIDKNSQRVSSETAYLTDDVLARQNLVVAIHASVTKIIFDTEATGGPRAVGVEFSKSKNGPKYQARARKEVVLSAGAVHSPHILMLSGVGNRKDLKKHEIPIIHDIPSVGYNLVDHPVVDLAFKDKKSTPKYMRPHSILEVFKLLGSVFQYFATRGGPLRTNVAEAAAFVRSDDPLLFEHSTEVHDTTSAADSPDLELFSTIFGYKDHGRYMYPVHTVGLHVTLLRPASRGMLRLKSSNPWDHPIIDPRYLEQHEDVEKLVRGVKLLFKVARTEPLASRVDHKATNPLLDHGLPQKSDEELGDIIRERVQTLYHPASTCRMAPLQDAGVVDSQLRVHGIQGLRVCDASVFPTIVSGHTAGAVYAIAEKLSDMLKAQYAVEKKA
ncbi:hypothetical protein D9615_004436 [Tricholomella constricta]|uniref:Glucose-methanol-choline oxidoreductase N-terminal domain-containing protein n=1 Tax=Tricholomella constricta TaxID=117010 RepID=A0A8H5M656_9AGAR|nr:hypothetical protein D9615_004436 [Tricholomella constricta]